MEMAFCSQFIFFLGHQPTPKEAAKELVSTLNITERSHLILDAAFGSLDLGKFYSDAGYLYTMSVNKQSQTRWLWAEMSKNICTGEGRVMMNKNGVVASLFSDSKNHTVYTNSWKIASSNDDSGQISSSESRSDRSESEGDEKESGDDISEGHEGAEVVVKKILEKRGAGPTAKYRTQWATDEITWETFSSFVDEDRFCQPFFQFATEADWKDGLQTFPQLKLKNMAIFLGVARSMYFFTLSSNFFFFRWNKNQTDPTNH